ncbi:unnamed protein product [Camellia sinensis]
MSLSLSLSLSVRTGMNLSISFSLALRFEFFSILCSLCFELDHCRTCILRSAESGQSYSKVHDKATQEVSS